MEPSPSPSTSAPHADPIRGRFERTGGVKERPARWGRALCSSNSLPAPTHAKRHFQLQARTFSRAQGALLKGTSWRLVVGLAKSRPSSSCSTECSRQLAGNELQSRIWIQAFHLLLLHKVITSHCCCFIHRGKIPSALIFCSDHRSSESHWRLSGC